VSSFFNNLGRSHVADYDTRRGFSSSTRVAHSPSFSPHNFGVEDLSQYAKEDLPGAIYCDEEDPFAPTASNTTSAWVTPWNLIFPSCTESPLTLPRPSTEPRSPKATSEHALFCPPLPLPLTPLPKLPPLPLVRSPPNSSTLTPLRSPSLRKKKFLLSTPLAPRLVLLRRRTTYVRPCRNPPYLELCHLWLSLLCQFHHQASCRLCRCRHLLLTKRTFAPLLKKLLRRLSIHTFLWRAYKTCCQSTRTSFSSSRLTDSKFGGLLVRARLHLS
jgi:hypothetical protein